MGDYDVGDMQISISEDRGQLIATAPQGSSPLLDRGHDRFDVAAAPGMSLSFTWDGTTPVLSFETEGRPKTGRRHPPGPAFKKIPELVGVWSGAVETYEGSRDVMLRVDEAGPIYLKLGAAPWTVLNGASFTDRRSAKNEAKYIPTAGGGWRPVGFLSFPFLV